MEQEAADAGKVAMDADLAVVEYLQGNIKKFAVFARLQRVWRFWMSSI